MKKFYWMAAVAVVLVAGFTVAQAVPTTGKGAPALAQTAVTNDVLAGRWGDNGDCTADVVFARDGGFHSYTGGDGRWSLNGDLLTIAGDGGVFELRVQLVDANHIRTVSADGSVNMSNRCPL